jgi:uncharacterized YkwD family protein
MKKTLIALTLSAVSLFSTSCSRPQKQAQKPKSPGVISSYSKMNTIQRVKVTADSANITSGYSNNSPIVQSAGKDSTFDVISPLQDWYAVKLPNSTIGFIPQSQSTPILSGTQTPNIPAGTTGTSTQAGTSTQPSTTPKTPAAQTNSGKLTSAEQQMINLVNSARAQNNLPALTIDMQLCNVARIKSQDMIDNNYFSHYSPKYGSPMDMLKAFGINFVQDGENIAGNQNVTSAENALMNSPEHRQNILNPNYTHIGVGIRQGGPYGSMFTQEFISKPQ